MAEVPLRVTCAGDAEKEAGYCSSPSSQERKRGGEGRREDVGRNMAQ